MLMTFLQILNCFILSLLPSSLAGHTEWSCLICGSSLRCSAGRPCFLLTTVTNEYMLWSVVLSNACSVLEGQPDTNAFVRTTTAVTMFNSGVKVGCHSVYTYIHIKLLSALMEIQLFPPPFFLWQINVMPAYAEAFVDFRIHSSQTLQEVRGQH